MALLTINIDDVSLLRQLNAAQEKGIGLEQQINEVLAPEPPVQTFMKMEKALDIALQRAEAQESGQEFTLEDLFTAAEWNEVPSRRVFGRHFRRAIDAGMPPIARHERKTITNKAVYKRLGHEH